MRSRLALILLGAMVASFSRADEGTALFDTPLEDLLDIKVASASKVAEPVERSPSVTTIVTRKEIESYGALSLADVLDRVTSLYAVGTLPVPRGMLSIRGDVTAEQNNHVLILLNGRPVRDSIYSGLNEEIYTAFPVAAIHRIEVVRGPGSVLYGTNAFVGVINIITRDATKQGVEPALRYGSFGTAQVETFAAQRIGDLELSGAVQATTAKGWRFTAADWDEATKTSTTKSQDRSDRTAGAMLLARYHRFTFNGYVGSEDIPFMSVTGETPTWSLSGNHRATRLTLDLGYENDLTPSWKHTLNLTYNRLGVINQSVGTTERATSNDAALEWTHYAALTPKLNALAGFVYTKQTGAGVVQETSAHIIPYYNDDLFSLYAQAGYQLFEPLRLIGGGQAIKAFDNPVNVVPRVAAIYNFDASLGAKILYSYAFRAPSESERNLIRVTPTKSEVLGNPSLLPEKTGVLDAQIFYHTRELQWALGYFRSAQRDLISLQPGGYINRGDETVQGVEAEVKYVAGEWTLQGNASYQRSVSQDGTVDDGHVPNWMFKGGVAWRASSWLNLGLYDSFYGVPTQVDNGGGATHMVNPDADYYHWMTLNAVLGVNQALGLNAFPDTELSLNVVNVLDAKVYYPEYVYGVINTFPGRPGVGAYAGLKVKL